MMKENAVYEAGIWKTAASMKNVGMLTKESSVYEIGLWMSAARESMKKA